MKKKLLVIGCGLLVILSGLIVCLYWNKSPEKAGYKDQLEEVDPNMLVLSDPTIRVTFEEVILSQPKETRKLVVFEQNATVKAKVEDRVFEHIDWSALTRSQTVSYTATGSFVVDLSNLSKNDIVDDKDNKILTIKIDHPMLDKIEVDPNKIKIGDTQRGLLTFGNIRLTLEDYISIEKSIQKQFKSKFDTSANGQKADDTALEMVKKIYEPIVKAVDGAYTVVIEFK